MQASSNAFECIFRGKCIAGLVAAAASLRRARLREPPRKPCGAGSEFLISESSVFFVSVISFSRCAPASRRFSFRVHVSDAVARRTAGKAAMARDHGGSLFAVVFLSAAARERAADEGFNPLLPRPS